MKTDTELQTIQVSYKEICEGERPWTALGNFMNDFFGNFPERRGDLVRDPVQEPANSTLDMHRWAVFCAASVEYLCQKYGLVCPDWVHEANYALPEPWFHSSAAEHKLHVRERIMRETPEAFTRRNIYCGNRIYNNKYEIIPDRRQPLLTA